MVAEDDKLALTLDNMSTEFRNRGYPSGLIKTHRSTVENKERNTLLQDDPKQKKANRIPFVTTYTEQSKFISNIINKTLDIS